MTARVTITTITITRTSGSESRTEQTRIVEGDEAVARELEAASKHASDMLSHACEEMRRALGEVFAPLRPPIHPTTKNTPLRCTACGCRDGMHYSHCVR